MWDVNDPFPATDSVEYVARMYSIDDACQLLMGAAYRMDERANRALYLAYDSRHECWLNCAYQLITSHYNPGTLSSPDDLGGGPSPDTIRQAVGLWSLSESDRDDFIPFGEMWEQYMKALTESIAGFMVGDESHIADSLVIFQFGASEVPIRVRVSERPAEERLVTVRRVTRDDWAHHTPDRSPS